MNTVLSGLAFLCEDELNVVDGYVRCVCVCVGVARVFSAWFLISLRSVRDGAGSGSPSRFRSLWCATTVSSTPRHSPSPTHLSQGHAHIVVLQEPSCDQAPPPRPPHPPLCRLHRALCCSRGSTVRLDSLQPAALHHRPLPPRPCPCPNLCVRVCVCAHGAEGQN